MPQKPRYAVAANYSGVEYSFLESRTRSSSLRRTTEPFEFPHFECLSTAADSYDQF